jgi:hypothetical protein
MRLGIGILLLFLHVKPGRYQRLDLFIKVLSLLWTNLSAASLGILVNGKGELFLEDQITG